MSNLFSSFPRSEILRPLHLKAVSWDCPYSFSFLLNNSFPEALLLILPLSMQLTYMHLGHPIQVCTRKGIKFLYRGPASLRRVKRLSKHLDFKSKEWNKAQKVSFQKSYLSCSFSSFSPSVHLANKTRSWFLTHLKVKLLMDANIIYAFSYLYSQRFLYFLFIYCPLQL